MKNCNSIWEKKIKSEYWMWLKWIAFDFNGTFLSVSYLHVDALQVWKKLCPFSFQKDLLYVNETENCGLGLVKSMVGFSEIRMFGIEELSLNMTSWRYTCSCYLQAVWEKLRTLEAVAQCGCRNNDGLAYGLSWKCSNNGCRLCTYFNQSRCLVYWLCAYTWLLFLNQRALRSFSWNKCKIS